ncbi:Fic/DOC family protein [Virgisporangium aliadipatigenens]|uniref:Fic/DOC family protein n=1 Tax=Virgisporangium aliadipatigenens TaxID=741659 RepID=UPI001943E040|nr:Fic family protein [Virgisporangium aliadipatigenens]
MELRIVAVRDVEIARTTVPGDYNLAHYKAFHRFLFRDVYEWAGESRTVDIAKPGSMFCHWRYVDDEVSSVLAQLMRDGHLIGYSLEGFLERLANYYGELNARHAFREGNGRATRAFLRQLAAAAGFLLDWSELDPDANIEACRVNLATAETAPLIKVLRPVVRRI